MLKVREMRDTNEVWNLMARAMGKNAEFPSFSNYCDYPTVKLIYHVVQPLKRLNV